MQQAPFVLAETGVETRQALTVSGRASPPAAADGLDVDAVGLADHLAGVSLWRRIRGSFLLSWLAPIRVLTPSMQGWKCSVSR